jgi:erythromycin esterase
MFEDMANLSDPRRRAKRGIRAVLVCVGGTLFVNGCGGERGTDPGGEDSLASIDSTRTAWLNGVVAPFETATVRNDRSALSVLGTIVGDSRMVSLGEATHGTREFFQMKHRVLDYLVRELGFTHFALEASLPEMNRVDEWVTAGVGDPVALLSGQYFWTWRTQSVLDLMTWAREYNQTRGPRPAVHILGFDMQYPGMAIHNVNQYLSGIEADSAMWTAERLSCMSANNARGAFPFDYGSRDATYRAECRGAIDDVMDFLDRHQAEYVALTSEPSFALARQSVRLIQQFEDMKSARIGSARDRAMAENAAWLLERGGPDAKIVLWAHNLHVSRRAGFMGDFLTNEEGIDHIIFGFSFLRGRFTAVTLGVGLETQVVDIPPPDTYAAHFGSTGFDRFILSLDGPLADPESSWLIGPRRFRSIGCCYNPSSASSYFYDAQLTDEYDAIIYFAQTTETLVLPFTPPDQF